MGRRNGPSGLCEDDDDESLASRKEAAGETKSPVFDYRPIGRTEMLCKSKLHYVF